jgi:hypothetical protein
MVQAATATECLSESALDKLAHDLAVPISQVNASSRRLRFQGRLAALRAG